MLIISVMSVNSYDNYFCLTLCVQGKKNAIFGFQGTWFFMVTMQTYIHSSINLRTLSPLTILALQITFVLNTSFSFYLQLKKV